MMNYHQMAPFDRPEYAVHESFLGYWLMKSAPIRPDMMHWEYRDIPLGINRITHACALVAHDGNDEHRFEFFIESDGEGEPQAMFLRRALNDEVDRESITYTRFKMHPYDLDCAKDAIMKVPLQQPSVTH